MEVGIVGLPGVGKGTLFRALTGGAGTPLGKAGGAQATVGMAAVPDPRLDEIATHIKTKAIIPATLQLVDIPGFATGGEAAAFARQVLAHIRQVDALCHVVRCFNAPGAGAPTPVSDIDELETEMILADLAVAEPARDKAARAARGADRESKHRLAALDRIIPILSDGQPIRSIHDQLSHEEQDAIYSYGMVTAKPVLYVANIGESEVGQDESPTSTAAQEVEQYATEHGGEAITLCATLEAEIAELDPADRVEMLESLGLAEPAASVVARGLYKLLGLSSFYTAGDKEVRAWPIPHGATAPEAAGVIHTDIQRGFIRAECYHVDDLTQLKSEKAIKEAGRMRSEGKNYRMQDGDVVHFLFNV